MCDLKITDSLLFYLLGLVLGGSATTTYLPPTHTSVNTLPKWSIPTFLGVL